MTFFMITYNTDTKLINNVINYCLCLSMFLGQKIILSEDCGVVILNYRYRVCGLD